MIDIDLAEPAQQLGPPSAHLLAPASLLLLLPIMIAAIAQQASADAYSHIVEADRLIASTSARAAAVAAEQREAALWQSMHDGAEKLRAANREVLELVRVVASGLPPNLRLSELVVEAKGIRVVGSAASAGDISLWLTRSHGRGGTRLVWQSPELRQVTSDDNRVDFNLRILRTEPGAKQVPS